jgi:putative FmdB family regulatory protein
MPTYEYRCDNGHKFEQFQRMSEPPIDKCPVCGARAERLLSAGAGLLFKGSGFYITDYRSEKYRKAAAEEGGGAAPDKKAGEKKSEGDMGASADTRSTGGGSSEGSTGGGGKSASADE